ncbi:glycoside hydrolase family protein, partial [Enterococcus sp. LJL51]|uniref:glycoside hydrolase family protein n=1 Tax=Enterococcus sp. LJL51 TaxID=3416656 RepID=UPI003CE9E3DC
TRSFNQNQFDAMVSLAYNCGTGIFTVDNWDRNASDSYITESFPNYINAGSEFEEGLRRRRQEEINLFNTPVSGNETGTETENKNQGEDDMTEFVILYGTGVFYVCGTKMKLLTQTEWSVLRSVYNQVTAHKTGKAQDIKIMDWKNNKATFDAYVGICGGYTT